MKNHFTKTYLLTIAFVGFLMGFSITSDKLNDLDKMHLKGNVKSVIEIKYALKEESGSKIKDVILYQKFSRFDTDGFETEYTVYTEGNEFLTSVITFGKDGLPEQMNEYNPDGTLNLNVTYKYDDKGFRQMAYYNWAENRKIGEISERTDYYFEIIRNDIFDKVLYKNEYRGYCTEENYLKADSTLSFRIEARYDFRGNKLESAYYHGSGRLSWMTKYKYDRYDNLIESRVYKSNRIAVISSFRYEFDSAGNWSVRHEDRTVHINILTEGLQRANTITERTIEYY